MTQQQWVEEELGDWSSVPKDFVPPQPSIYKARVVLAEPSPTKDGRPQIRVDVELVHDMVADEPAKGTLKYQNALITTGSGGFRIAQLCDSAEVSPPSDTKLDTIKDFCETLVGCEVYLRSNLKPDFKDKTISRAGVARYLTAEQAQEAASQAEAA